MRLQEFHMYDFSGVLPEPSVLAATKLTFLWFMGGDCNGTLPAYYSQLR